MSDTVVDRQITADMVVTAVNLVTFYRGRTIERPEPPCGWPRLCSEQACRFPRYYRDGQPTGLVSHVLLRLGYPSDLLKALDMEYELGEVLHPGVKIGRSRNPALVRIDVPGRQLLSFLQDRQKLGRSWNSISAEAVRRERTLAFLDARRRPWLY